MLRINSPYVALAALTTELAGIFVLNPQDSDVLRRVLIMSGYGLAVVFVWRNRRSRPLQLLGLGLLLNLLPMLANGGLMPLTPERAAHAGLSEKFPTITTGSAIPRTKDVLKDGVDVRIAPLSDVLVLPPGLGLHAVASAGDLVIAAGLIYGLTRLVFDQLSQRRQRASAPPSSSAFVPPRHESRLPSSD